ncbi:MAG: xylobiose transport system permease protein [Actinomycetota bacterium]|nr:xylobiose transport system permease protein [Actinomycetota bacterium]
MNSVATAQTQKVPLPLRPSPWTRLSKRLRSANYPAGVASLFWLAVIGIPLYALVASTFRKTSDYLDQGPLSVPSNPTFENYHKVVDMGFDTYFINTVIVTVCTVAIVVLLSVPIGYAVVRSTTRSTQRVFQFFLLGLAIPAQAVVIPVFLIITELHMYDSLAAVILPSAAFSMPVCVLILTGTMRDISEELYEAMALEGVSVAKMLWYLTIPLSRSGLSTVAIYTAIQAWNGFLFPLILTQSREQRVLTLGLYDFVGEFRVDAPGMLTAVLLSAVPLFVAYLFARRALVQGLMGVGGK